MHAPGPPDDGSFSAKVYRAWNRSPRALADPRDTDPANQGKANRALDATKQWLDPFFANRVGFLTVFYGFALGYGASYILGYKDGELTEAIGGALIAATDLGIRVGRHRGKWLGRSSGGTLFFLPVFVFGILWSVLGTIDAM